MQELDIVDTWTRANEPLPRPTLSYVISPLMAAGGMPQCWSMVHGAIDGATAWVIEDSEVSFRLYFAHGLTGEQRERAIASFQAACGRLANP